VPVSNWVESIVLQWEDGYRRLEAANSEPDVHRALGRAVLAVEDELRKRLGSTFSIEELAMLYRDDSDWGLELTIHTLPGRSELWDSSTVVDAAFYLYMREAADFAGGALRRTRPEFA
jgi:hypothetical protein